jgi:hypothetical protein
MRPMSASRLIPTGAAADLRSWVRSIIVRAEPTSACRMARLASKEVPDLIGDDRVVEVDQVVRGVGEEGVTFVRADPLRRRIGSPSKEGHVETGLADGGDMPVCAAFDKIEVHLLVLCLTGLQQRGKEARPERGDETYPNDAVLAFSDRANLLRCIADLVDRLPCAADELLSRICELDARASDLG